MADLVVLGQDPRFGGGAWAQTEAFLAGAQALGRSPELFYAPHPTFDGRRGTLDKIEAVRQLRSGWRYAARARSAKSVWVAATIATNGFAAVRSGRPYRCWIGTTLADEWAARAHGLDPARKLAHRLNAPPLRAIERSVLRGAERVYTISQSASAAVAAAAGLDEEAVGVLPIPVDIDRFAPEPDERWLQRLGAPTIVFVGRADDTRKNLPLLLDALPAIRARVPGVRLQLIGRPPASPPEGIEVLGSLPSVAEPLREATLLVLPSWQEGFGIVVAEALAAGVPVLTTPSGGPEHLVRTSGGGVVLEGFDPEELAAAATALLGDVDTLMRMRASGREYVVREHSPARFRELLADAL
jgi:glycosyltransferase involved in cell wall biosynthesis